MRRMITAALILALVAYQPGAAPADDPPADDPPGVDSKAEAARATLAVELAKKEAGHYRLELEGGSKRAAVLHPDSLLQWSNPVAGSLHGSVFVWTDRGCPVAVASIYKWFSPNTHVGIELMALSPDLVSADRKGRRVWSPGRSALDRKPIPGAPKPLDTPEGRLRQLRELAREYAATKTIPPDLGHELRLLTRPIYRYQSTNPEVLDGALFAFVEGTDPEIILAIEARQADGKVEWQYGVARVNHVALRLTHKGREAWTGPAIPWSQTRDPRLPYTLIMYGTDPGAIPDDPEE